MTMTQRPYKHTVTRVNEHGGIFLVILATYATRASAVRAAKRADGAIPDETREVRLRNRTLVNRYHDGPVASWSEDG